jgi:hypothetical protein
VDRCSLYQSVQPCGKESSSGTGEHDLWKDEEVLIWFGIMDVIFRAFLSEKVHYFITTTERNKTHPRPLPSLEWTFPELQVVEEPSATSVYKNSITPEIQPRRLKPAKRFVTLRLPWACWIANKSFRLFGSMHEDMVNKFELQLKLFTSDDLGRNLTILVDSEECKLDFKLPESGDAGLKLVPQTRRSTTLRLEHKEQEGVKKITKAKSK